jgi:hypothetical protein
VSTPIGSDSITSQCAQLAQQSRERKIEARERNRREHPEIAALIDGLRAKGVQILGFELRARDGRLIGGAPLPPKPRGTFEVSANALLLLREWYRMRKIR